MARGPDRSQDPGRRAIQRGACHCVKRARLSQESPRCSYSMLAFLGGCLSFSSEHLINFHWSQGLAIPSEA